MARSRVDQERSDGSLVPRWFLSAERWLRSHPIGVAAAAVAGMVAIASVQRQIEGGLSLALSYSVPIALCAYGVGLSAGVAMAAAVAGLWAVDTADVGLSLSQMSSVFAVRLLMNLGVVVIAALGGAAARARERYIERQRQLAQLRTDLVSAFSHDLRSPLATIAGYAELLQAGPGNPPAFDPAVAIEAIRREVSRVDKLVADMLGAARDEGKAALQVSQFELASLVTELQSELGSVRRSDRVTLRWQVEPTLPVLRTDRAKLVSIVRNLVNNAFKFTQRGTVWVRFAYARDGDAFRIEVEDTGSGIPQEALPHLFERFYRSPDTQRVDGFGLGLFIVNRFCELLGGSIVVRSEEGRGTCFTVTIPRVLEAAAPVAFPGTAA